MTLIVGILCSDGVVIASDSAATLVDDARPTIGQMPAKKIKIVRERLLFSSAGSVGMSQVLSDRIAKLWVEGRLKSTGTNSPERVGDTIGNEIGNSVKPYFETAQLQRQLAVNAGSCLCKSMLALPFRDEACLFNFDFGGVPERQTPELPFVCIGSGQPIADPFLAFLYRVLWQRRQPTLAQGKLSAIWTIEHVLKTNPGGVALDQQLGVLRRSEPDRWEACLLDTSEIQEHLQQIVSIEEELGASARGDGQSPPDEVPRPSDPTT